MVLNQLANAIVQYTAVNNVLPGSWSDISPIVEDSLRYYIPDNINPTRSWDGTAPTGAGQFIDGSGFASDGVATPDVANNIGAQGSTTGADTASNKLLIFTQAQCLSTDPVAGGGIRYMVVVYRLEGQDNILCLGSFRFRVRGSPAAVSDRPDNGLGATRA